MSVSRLESLLTEYGHNHQNPTNKTIHWIMVPLIYWSLEGVLWEIPVKIGVNLNAALLLSIPVAVYYLCLSFTLGVGLLLFNSGCLTLCLLIEAFMPTPLWQLALTVFITAWGFQFIGHKIEGKRPSFFKDVQFLLIGPAWLMHALYLRLGIST